MTSKLAGHLPLQDMIERTIQSTKNKLAAVDKIEGTKNPDIQSYDERVANAVDFDDVEAIDKLAEALDYIGNKFLKTSADSINIGAESHQGGMVLPTGDRVGGKQLYAKVTSKYGKIPLNPGLQRASDNGPARTLMDDNEDAPTGMHSPYPHNGVLRTIGSGVEKKSSVNYILNKIAESVQGGMTLDGTTASIPSDKGGGNSARKNIESVRAAIAMTKEDGKAPQRRMLAEVLKEPALVKKYDKTLEDNLTGTAKAGVKIAAAKAYLSKIASDPSNPKHEKLMSLIATRG